MKQRAAATANEAERALVDARRDASDTNNETARRLMESQAEAARITAEAARQLAEVCVGSGGCMRLQNLVGALLLLLPLPLFAKSKTCDLLEKSCSSQQAYCTV